MIATEHDWALPYRLLSGALLRWRTRQLRALRALLLAPSFSGWEKRETGQELQRLLPNGSPRRNVRWGWLSSMEGPPWVAWSLPCSSHASSLPWLAGGFLFCSLVHWVSSGWLRGLRFTGRFRSIRASLKKNATISWRVSLQLR